MIVVISQPMLFPWVGMFEQMRAADAFVWYTDVQFSKGSFVNRVQIKTENGMRWLTVPLCGLKLGQRINEVQIESRRDWRAEHLDLLAKAYASAPFLDDMIELVESVYAQSYPDIGSLSEASQMEILRYYGLDRKLRMFDAKLLNVGGSGTQRVLDIVLSLGGNTYLTGHGASRYLDHNAFEQAGIRVEYMDYAKEPYPQLHGEFTPYVSALDLIANLGPTGLNVIRPASRYWKEFLT